jgi:hypothetical protein
MGIIVPPGEVADRQASEQAAATTVLLERSSGTQNDLWIFPYLLSQRKELFNTITQNPPNGRDEIKLFYSNGAVDVNTTNFKLILMGRRNVDIRIIDVRANEISRSQRLGEGASILTPGPQGQDESLLLGFDLDNSDLSAKKVDDPLSVFATDGFFGGSVFEGSTVSLARNEQQVFQIIGRSLEYYVEWTIQVDLLVNGEMSNLNIDANGQPFRTCGAYPSFGDPTGPDENKYSEVYLRKVYDERFINADEREQRQFVRVK